MVLPISIWKEELDTGVDAEHSVGNAEQIALGFGELPAATGFAVGARNDG